MLVDHWKMLPKLGHIHRKAPSISRFWMTEIVHQMYIPCSFCFNCLYCLYCFSIVFPMFFPDQVVFEDYDYMVITKPPWWHCTNCNHGPDLLRQVQDGTSEQTESRKAMIEQLLTKTGTSALHDYIILRFLGLLKSILYFPPIKKTSSFWDVYIFVVFFAR